MFIVAALLNEKLLWYVIKINVMKCCFQWCRNCINITYKNIYIFFNQTAAEVTILLSDYLWVFSYIDNTTLLQHGFVAFTLVYKQKMEVEIQFCCHFVYYWETSTWGNWVLLIDPTYRLQHCSMMKTLLQKIFSI